MSLRDTEKAVQPSKPKPTDPQISWNGEKGFIDTAGMVGEPDPALWAEIIADWGLSPEYTEIVDGSVHIRAWDTNVGDGETTRLRYYRAQIRRREPSDLPSENVEELIRQIQKRKPLKASEKKPLGERALVALCADWQLGKSEGGGVEATVERICNAQDAFVAKVKYLIKIGRCPSMLVVCGMGDIIENCDGHYAAQRFLVSLTRREQKDLGVTLVDRFVELLVQNFPELPILLLAVPGNHGENRSGGKLFTDWLDNDDLDVFTTAYRAFLKNPERYSNVSMPQFDGLIQEDLTLTYEVAGVKIGLAHGHQFRSGANAQAKMETWWKNQIMGNQPIAEARILFAGHLHHFIASESTGRQVFQCPAMDGGSKWFTYTSGSNSHAGMLTVGIGNDYGPRGWGDLEIL